MGARLEAASRLEDGALDQGRMDPGTAHPEEQEAFTLLLGWASLSGTGHWCVTSLTSRLEAKGPD